jgi:hypothetical protein
MAASYERDYSYIRQALQLVPEAAFELSPDTHRRYSHGLIPQMFQWLLRHPKLLRILADYAEADEARLKGVELGEQKEK